MNAASGAIPGAPQFDALIIGQGIAGSTLAWRLIERGLRPMVIDRGGLDDQGRPTSSRIAAGLITPITGKRLTLSPDWESFWPIARDFYRSVEQLTGRSVMTQTPAIRLFTKEAERQKFEERTRDPAYAEQVETLDLAVLPSGLMAPHGGFAMRHAARLRVESYLEATREYLSQRGQYLQAEIDIDREIERNDDGIGLSRLGIQAKRLVLCKGYSNSPSQWFDDQRLAPAKGEILLIDAKDLQLEKVTHRGIWIAPEGEGRYRVGSTHEWEQLDSSPTDAGREELLARLAAVYRGPIKVVEHRAAVRPATPDRQPIVGFHSNEPRIGWLNGLGAKGALWGPKYAEELAKLCLR